MSFLKIEVILSWEAHSPTQGMGQVRPQKFETLCVFPGKTTRASGGSAHIWQHNVWERSILGGKEHLLLCCVCARSQSQESLKILGMDSKENSKQESSLPTMWTFHEVWSNFPPGDFFFFSCSLLSVPLQEMPQEGSPFPWVFRCFTEPQA